MSPLRNLWITWLGWFPELVNFQELFCIATLLLHPFRVLF